MASIFILHAKDEGALALQITQEISFRRSHLDVVMFDASTVFSDERSDALVLGQAAAADCVILIWSRSMAVAARSGVAVHASIQAWARDRFVMGQPDDAELPPGLRDLASQPLKAAPALESIDARNAGVGVRYLVNLVEDRVRVAERERPVGTQGRPRSAPDFPVLPGSTDGPRAAAGPSAPAANPRRGHWGIFSMAAALVLLAAGAVGFYLTLQGMPQPDKSKPAPPGDTSSQSPVGTAGSDTAPWIIGGVLLASLIGGGLFLLSRRRVSSATPGGTHEVVRRRIERPAPAEADVVPSSSTGGAEPSHHVFVSYSHSDADAVRTIVKQIEDAGFRVWIDTNIVGAAQRYAKQIVDAIEGSRVVALMGSRNSFGSDHVVREIYVAGDLRKAFLVVQLDDAKIPNELLYFITGFPRVNASESAPERMRTELARFVAA